MGLASPRSFHPNKKPEPHDASHSKRLRYRLHGGGLPRCWRPSGLSRCSAIPWPAKLAGDHGTQDPGDACRETFVGAWSVVIRTVIIDNLIREAIGEGVDTILNLGAGLDTRPYRMALPKIAALGRGGLPARDRAEGGAPRRRATLAAGSIASSSISPTAPPGGSSWPI